MGIISLRKAGILKRITMPLNPSRPRLVSEQGPGDLWGVRPVIIAPRGTFPTCSGLAATFTLGVVFYVSEANN